MRRGAKAYFAANLVSQLSALARYAALARILGPEQLGIAAMIILTSQFFQLVSDTGSDRFIVQDRDGDTPEMQGMVQLVLVVRGVLIAVALVTFSGLVASLFHAPQLKTPIMLLAIWPLVYGFIHLDFRRVQRESDFRPESLGMLVAEPLGLLTVVGAALLTRDASAVVYGLAVRAIVLVGMSHLTAKRPYRWAFSRVESARFSAYAMPLALNGVLLFFGSQADRLLVAHGMGATALGHYSAVLLLIYYPTTMLVRLLVGLTLPQIARTRDSPERYAQEREKLGGRITLLGIVFLVGFVVVGPIATPILYGKAFIEPLQLFGFVGALQTARFLRVWPTTLANSIGRSTIILGNNIARFACLPIAYVVSTVFQTTEAIVIGLFTGELVALLTALWLLSRAGSVELGRELVRLGAFLLCAAIAAGGTWAFEAGQTAALVAAVAAVPFAIGLILTTERVVILDIVQKARERLARLRART